MEKQKANRLKCDICGRLNESVELTCKYGKNEYLCFNCREGYDY